MLVRSRLGGNGISELYRFHQPVGKQYTYGKGITELSEVEQLRLQVELLKKYQSLVRESTK